MNSLYGKFGERMRVKWYRHLSENDNPFANVIGDYAEVVEEILPAHSNVIIAAYVTAYARITLFEAMVQVLEAGGEILYCDTDSLIFRGKNVLTMGDKLGQWKKEADIVSIEIRGNKYYRYTVKNGEKRFVCKGVPRDLQALMIRDRQVQWKKPIRFHGRKSIFT